MVAQTTSAHKNASAIALFRLRETVFSWEHGPVA